MALVYSEHLPLGVGIFTPATPPTEGNLLVILAPTRGGDTNNLESISGWTIVESPLTTSGVGPAGTSMFYRIAGPADGAWFLDTNQCELHYSEWSGYGALLDSTSGEVDPGASPYAFDCGGSVTPSTTDPVLVIGGISLPLQNDTAIMSVEPDGDSTELDDWDTEPSVQGSPGRWVGYREVASPSGSYAVGGTLTVAGITNPYVGITAAFAAAAGPPPNPVEFEICGPDGTGCVLIERATAKKVRVELNGTGSGAFQISRYDVQATNDILAPANIVRCTFPEIHSEPLVEFLLEEGDFTLVSSDEEGGELLSFGGKGTLNSLAYAVLGHQWLDTGHPKLNFPKEGVWRWGATIANASAAGILRRIIFEAQLHTPPAIPGVTHGGSPVWDDTNDSLGNAFYDLVGTWEIPIGRDLLTAALDLARAGMFEMEMRPGLELWLYDEQGSDKTGDFGTGNVRFEKGVNIGGFDNTEVARQISNENYTTRVLLEGSAGGYLWVPTAAPSPLPDYVKESYLSLKGTNSSNDQERAAARAQLRGLQELEAILLEVTPTGPHGEENDEALGFYYPGWDGTDHGKYWLGDYVTLHTGDNPDLDFMDATFRIHAITLYEDETGALAPPIVELNAQFTAPDSSGGGPSGGSTSEGGSGGGGTAVNTPHSHSQYQVSVDDKWHQPVRVATTGMITISTALNDGDTIDGVTLAEGDRVLVKNQGTASQNGIYVVAATPLRAIDFDEDSEVMGSVVLVIAGTANAGTAWRVENTADPDVGTDDIDFAELVAGSSLPPGTDPGDLLVWDGADWVVFPVGTDGQMIYADSGETLGLLWDAAPSGSGITVEDEGSPLSTAADTLDFVGAGVTASGTGTTKTITIPGGGGGDPFDGKPYIWTPPSSAQTEDDEFNDDTSMSGPGNGLDAKWTKRNMGTASWLKLDDTYAPGAAFFDIPTGQAADQGIYQTVPAGDWTFAARMHGHRTSDRQYWGIFCLSSAGTGVMAVMDNGADGANGVRVITTWGDGGAGTFWSTEAWRTDISSANRQPGTPLTISLRKASGVYSMGFSAGDKLLPLGFAEVSHTPTSFTAAFIGFGRLGGTGISKVVLDFFRKVA